ncbi:hypothetical protein [Cytobacillus sp. NCCP-133]|uniref:hypothetical protein n=1 Tax=Cytobacillus sp. NCCP-133 TaxID=766848 RepID=UPI0022308C9D|nr:hypothetical protein [Cytobacillus sp. NCCP-133]GLB61042.1 hypothetical protein NCCP133_31730 [Cytobacillus sp. NCCP-133]
MLATLPLLARPLPVSGKGLFVFKNLYRLLVEVFLLPYKAWQYNSSTDITARKQREAINT